MRSGSFPTFIFWQQQPTKPLTHRQIDYFQKKHFYTTSSTVRYKIRQSLRTFSSTGQRSLHLKAYLRLGSLISATGTLLELAILALSLHFLALLLLYLN